MTTVRYILWPLCGTHSNHCTVHILTTVRYIYWPLCGTYSDHCVVHIVTTVRYILWPLCGTYSDHCAVHIVITVRYIYWPLLPTHIFTVEWLLHLGLHVGFHQWRLLCILLSSSTSHPPVAALLYTTLPTQCQVQFANSVGAYWSIAVERSALCRRSWGRISDRKSVILSHSFNTNSLYCRHLLKYRFWSLLASLTDNAWSGNMLLIGGYSVRMDWNFYCLVVTICTASLTFSNSPFCPHSVFMCFVWITEQTAIISLYSINWLVCITETESVYCAVWTGYLN